MSNKENGNGRFVSTRTAATAGTVVISLCGFLAFLWYWQSSQDEKVQASQVALGRVETSLDSHKEAADKTFDRIDTTLNAQQTLLGKTSEALARVQTSQDQVVKALDELKDTIKKSNGGSP